MRSRLIFFAAMVGVCSEDATFRNVTVEYETTRDDDDSFVHVESCATLREKLPGTDVSRVTVIGSVPVIFRNSVADLPELAILQLQRVGVEEIKPGAFRNVPRLRTLRLNGNKLKRIEDGVFTNLNLVFLSLEHNNIETISANAFDNLTDLQVLSLDVNRLKAFNSRWLKDKRALSTISLTYNRIEEIPKGAFTNYHNDAIFNNNRIRSISGDIFDDKKKLLGQLWLRNNEIERWDEDFLEGVELKGFDISDNKIECIEGNLSNFFVAFQTWIDGNPWKCECLMKIDKWAAQQKNKRIRMNSSVKKCNKNE